MKKIVVLGVSASGKSTFARKLSIKLNIPLTLIDSIMWKPGWKYVGDEEIQKSIEKISTGDEYILEGYITKNARKKLFDEADTLIYLDYPGFISAIRYIKRWWKHRKLPRPELVGSPEKFSFKFLKLVYTKGESYSLNKLLNEGVYDNKIIRLKSPKQAALFLNSL